MTPHVPDGAGLLGERSLSSVDVVHHTDLLSLCRALGDASIDMILCDLPYGTTACSWDTVIPFAPMWAQFKRVIKPRGAIVLTASQPFTSTLVMSNPGMFKHSWVWNKSLSGSFQNAKVQPLKITEDVLVFGKESVTYFPIMEKRNLRFKSGHHGSDVVGKTLKPNAAYQSNTYYPTNILKFTNAANKILNVHPTQKPVALFEYLIRTYTQPGDVVLDPCVGSGTTAVACRNLDRRYICGDSSAEYVAVARKRLQDTDPFQATVLPNGAVQHSLWEGLA